MEYLHYFETTSAHDAAYSDWGGEYKEPWVGYNAQTSSISYNDPEYVEIPSGYRFFGKGPVTIDSSDYDGEVRNSLLYNISGPVPPDNYYKLYIDGTVYPLKARSIMNEFDHYYVTGLADGVYPDCIYLT